MKNIMKVKLNVFLKFALISVIWMPNFLNGQVLKSVKKKEKTESTTNTAEKFVKNIYAKKISLRDFSYYEIELSNKLKQDRVNSIKNNKAGLLDFEPYFGTQDDSGISVLKIETINFKYLPFNVFAFNITLKKEFSSNQKIVDNVTIYIQTKNEKFYVYDIEYNHYSEGFTACLRKMFELEPANP